MICKRGDHIFQIGNIYNGFEILDILPKLNGQTSRKYACKCIKCKNITEKYSTNIMRRGCGICSNQVIIKGINDSLTTNPELHKYVVNPLEFENKSIGSNKKVKAKCPDCGYIKSISLHSLFVNGIACPKCGDGVSFANKFMFNLIEQCGVQFENERKFKWSNNKIYDFYIPSLSLIIESNGKQHYSKYGFASLGGKKIEEVVVNDKEKRQLAIKNGIKNYIEIDCYVSTLDYIKNSVINTNLLNILNVKEEDINWEECLKFASKNFVKEIAYLFENSNNISTTEIGEKYGLTKQTIIHYLKTATQIGWCDYNPKNEMKRIGSINGHNRSQKVICYEHSEIIYENAVQCQNDLNKQYNYGLEENNIRNTCRYKQSYHKKLHFFYYYKMNSCDIKCTGIEEGSGRNKGTLGALVCDYKGNKVNVGSGFSDEDRKRIWQHPEDVIDKIITVKYKEETKNKDGGISIQFPVFETVRFDKNEPSYN